MGIAVQSHPWQNIRKVPFQPMACISILMLQGETQIERQRFRLAWAKRETLSKKLKQVRGWLKW
jgi:hypothetical protein